GIASALPKTEWEQLWQSEKALTPQAELTSILAALGRPEPDRDEALERITAVLTHTSEAYLRQQALRLIMIALGDWNLHKPFTEVYTAYTLAEPLKRDQRELLLPILRAAYPAPDSVSNFEISRLLAMLMDDSPETVSKTVRFFTDEANPTTEFHYLVVLSRLRGAWPEGAVDQVANTVLRLDHKLEGREQRSKQNWGKRLNEVIQKLNEREPAFAARLVADPAFPTAGHLIFTEALEGEPLRQAATIYLKQVKENTQFQWSPTLVRLLGLLPSSETFPLFTNQWENMGLRESLVIEFLKDQRPELRSFYLWGLNSPRPSIVAGSLNALLKFPPQSDRETLAALAKLFQRSFDEPRAAAIRKQGITLLRHSLGENQFWSSFQIDVEMEKRIDTVTSSTNVIKSELHSVLVPLLEGITRVNPEAVSQLQGVNWEEWRKRLSAISWESGNIKRGESVFQMRACATCHSGAGSLGPDLRGAAKRFSPEDLFAAIVVPEKDVAPPYRPIVYQTRSGQLHTGIISFSSADGVILQTGPSMNVRLDDAEIISSQPAEGSLMPSGLLDGAQSQELADLYAYLKSL
ncbi:MAG: c-type cytochrome, partial [Verrucomicrobiota bacterium]|nr:c-type cytochrome [Verrucomicrobiota bacterium]